MRGHGLVFIVILSLTPAALGAPTTSVTPVVAPKVNAIVKPYSVSLSLKEVSNLKQFQKAATISTGEKRLLATNLFAVAPVGDIQLFNIYEQNDYSNIPSFITTDSVLQMYHIFYDYTLRTTEEEKLIPALKVLTAHMVKQTMATYNTSHNHSVREAALYNAAYFTVAADELGIKVSVPAAVRQMADKAVTLISGHGGVDATDIVANYVDFSQFVPRGHYTRSEALKSYFKAMMWYGLVPLCPDQSLADSDNRLYLQILVMTHDLYASRMVNEWQTIYEPTAFYVGAADDLRPDEINHIVATIYGNGGDADRYSNSASLKKFVVAFNALRGPRIKGNLHGVLGTVPGGRQFRFMGQRYIADSEMTQILAPGPERSFPAGLDIMAVLGSRHAADILDNNQDIYNPGNWKPYVPLRTALTKRFAAVPASLWSSNLYWSWLDTLRILITPEPAGYPSFMRSTAWQKKTLSTSLASWAELRHDTILYAKQSTAAECGGGGDGTFIPPPVVHGYVEPNVAFYNRLLELTEQSQSGLRKRNLLTDEVNEQFGSVEDLLVELRTMAIKELRNTPLTAEEYDSIRYFGGQLEQLTLGVIGATGEGDWSLIDEADRDIAGIADVHSTEVSCLEEGVGHADEVLVVVPIDGKLVLTRGAVFSYYEFQQPVGDRMTDEEWQGLLNAGKTPESPVWTKTYRTNRPATIDPAESRYDGRTGC